MIITLGSELRLVAWENVQCIKVFLNACVCKATYWVLQHDDKIGDKIANYTSTHQRHYELLQIYNMYVYDALYFYEYSMSQKNNAFYTILSWTNLRFIIRYTEIFQVSPHFSSVCFLQFVPHSELLYLTYRLISSLLPLPQKHWFAYWRIINVFFFMYV